MNAHTDSEVVENDPAVTPQVAEFLDSHHVLVSITPGLFNADAIHIYKNGQCLALAAELSRETGWPVLLRLLDDPEDAENPFLIHAYAQNEDGDIVDISGLHDRFAVADEFGDDERLVLVEAADVNAMLERFQGVHADLNLPVAGSFVGLVLDAYDREVKTSAPRLSSAGRGTEPTGATPAEVTAPRQLSIIDFAEYLLAEHGEMSTMKLQKLLYFSQGWSLAWTGEPLFVEEFEAWASGPVCRELHELHRGEYSVAPGFFYEKLRAIPATTSVQEAKL